MRHGDFNNIVASNWMLSHQGFRMFKFMSKLRRFKEALQTWNSIVFGNIVYKVHQREEEVKSLEQIFDASHADTYIITLNQAQAGLFRSLIEEEDFWPLKTRVRWL